MTKANSNTTKPVRFNKWNVTNNEDINSRKKKNFNFLFLTNMDIGSPITPISMDSPTRVADKLSSPSGPRKNSLLTLISSPVFIILLPTIENISIP